MRKIIFFLILLLIIGVGAIAASSLLREKARLAAIPKPVLLKVGLVSDSHNDNLFLAEALAELKLQNVAFVIGLGDYTDIGTTKELLAAKKVFDDSHLKYYVLPGDHDLWDGRNQQLEEGSGSAKTALDNFGNVFGQQSFVHEENKVKFIGIDNSDIYRGIDEAGWQQLNSLKLRVDSSRKLQEKETVNREPKTDNRLTFVMAHKTPFHPDSNHVMGQDSAKVADQAKKFMGLMEQKKVDGFFSGDLHFFAKFKSPSGFVRMTTIGAVDADRNFQGPRYAVLTVYDDYSWEVEDVEIR